MAKEPTRAQEIVLTALEFANELDVERLAKQDPTSELNTIVAQQGQAMRATISTCTAAIVAALEQQ